MSLFGRLSRQMNMAEDKKKRVNLQEELNQTLRRNLEEAKQQYPTSVNDFDAFLPLIQQEITLYMFGQEDDTKEKTVDSDFSKAKDAISVFYISEDKMAAYACVLPPLNEGKDIEQTTFEEDLKYAGIVYGIDKLLMSEIIEDRKYLTPFPIAAGLPPKDGQDGVITENFKRIQALNIELQEGDSIDFDQEYPMQIIKKDAVICQVQPATKAEHGTDVVGNLLNGSDGTEIQIFPGPNTSLSKDKCRLTASIDGVVSLTEEGGFCVQPQRSISGDVGRHTGNIYCKGDLFISGNVRDDIIVKASGDIIIGGEVREAKITAGGSIRIQKKCTKGQTEPELRADGQIQCAVIENSEVHAGGNVYAEVIMDSRVISGSSVYVQSGRGLLIGGEVKARTNVSAKEIGNLSECSNSISVGYQPGVKEELQEKESSLKEATSTLNKLRKNVSALKSFGNTISHEKRKVLAQLEEQRGLYEKKVSELADEIKALTVILHKASAGDVSCEKMYPVTEIYIGDKRKVVREVLTNCKVYLQGDTIVAR